MIKPKQQPPAPPTIDTSGIVGFERLKLASTYRVNAEAGTVDFLGGEKRRPIATFCKITLRTMYHQRADLIAHADALNLASIASFARHQHDLIETALFVFHRNDSKQGLVPA